jgi:hypothetical protein
MRLLVSSSPKVLPSLVPEYGDCLGTLVTPSNGALPQAMRLGLPWACDNDCYQGLDEAAYRRMLAGVKGKEGCLWVSVPDVVADARATLERFHRWKDEARALSGQPLALVGQDGLESLDVPWGDFDALFIGGSTEWKLSRAACGLASEALERGKRLHMGRVNTMTRYRLAHSWGCHTIDGTNVCLWPSQLLPRCVRWLRALDEQPSLFA